MTAAEYWDGDPALTKYARRAYAMKKERMNEELWLQGMYIYDALCNVAPIFRSFSKKGTKAGEYPERPYAITREEIERRKLEQEKARMDKIKAKLMSFAIQHNARMAKSDREEVT